MLFGIETEYLTQPFLLSGKIIFVSIFLFIFLGIPLAYFLSKENLKFKWFFETFVTLPLIFPPIATGFILLMLLGRESFIGSYFKTMDVSFIFEFPGLVIAAFIAGIPLMVKPIQSSIEQFPKNIQEASFTSGKSKFQTLLFIVLPNIKKTVIAALLIAVARALGEVGITLMLGGNIVGKTDTVSLAIYNAVFDGEYELAAILSTILIIISMIIFIILHFLDEKRKSYV